MGWVLLPVVPRLKEPHRVLLKELYGDTRISLLEQAPPLLLEVEHWFVKDPYMNLAVMPGAVSGLAVADLDHLDVFDPQLQTPTAMSGRVGGGKHLYFLHEHPLSQERMWWGDLNPRIVVLPGSLHLTEAHYRWCDGLSLNDVPFMRLEDAAGVLGIEHLL